MKPDAAAVAAQIHAANAILRHLGKPPREFELREVLVADIRPSQAGEDYDNASSRELAARRRTDGNRRRSPGGETRAGAAPFCKPALAASWDRVFFFGSRHEGGAVVPANGDRISKEERHAGVPLFDRRSCLMLFGT